ncbi:probable bifunctional riboflavin biosynthesis protein RIBA 1, chloroplastic [Magnolia sinica]|uniref:probable bifunctional riboflavin biosynthesis protein RIBA 1, chloroplastic n=1 Tax=Magnolia sinica TaxID=86752 RepID=UPI00265971A8|nr:probable bifunctional riboflavin biosynthesis protein RIBA 1, chloroplastic [Magnolia sinica]
MCEGSVLRTTEKTGYFSVINDQICNQEADLDRPDGNHANHDPSYEDRIDGVDEITPLVDEFVIDNEVLDVDGHVKGFTSIPEAIEDIRRGKFVIVVDDEDRENEGDLIMAASIVTPEAMAYIVKHGTGIVCVSMKEGDLERLQLPLMVTHKENEEKLRTAFTITVDAKVGTTTGVSAKDRANTILALASHHSKPEDFNCPGHIFPLKYRKGGVLKRPGCTEAVVDLAILTGLNPIGVLCEIVDDEDGSMARLPKLREFARKEKLKIISIADLIRFLQTYMANPQSKKA